MKNGESHDPQPSDSTADGPQELESGDTSLVPQEDFKRLLQRDDIGDTVSGLAELDPSFMGGAPASILLVNWLNQLCGQVRDLQNENRSLQSQVISSRVQNAELVGKIKQHKAYRRLRGISITGGALLVGGAYGFFGVAPGLAVITGFVGVLLLVVGWDVIPFSRGKS